MLSLCFLLFQTAYLYHNSDLDYQDSLMYEYVHQHKLAPYIYLLGFIMVAKIHFLD